MTIRRFVILYINGDMMIRLLLVAYNPRVKVCFKMTDSSKLKSEKPNSIYAFL